MKIRNFRFAILTLEWERQEQDPPARESDTYSSTERAPEEMYGEAKAARGMGFVRNGEQRSID